VQTEKASRQSEIQKILRQAKKVSEELCRLNAPAPTITDDWKPTEGKGELLQNAVNLLMANVTTNQHKETA
jgi:hypothetical protein